MSDRLAYSIIGVCIIVLCGALIWAMIVDADARSLDDQCARMGYTEHMELWGLQWCVRMDEGELVGVQVEGEMR